MEELNFVEEAERIYVENEKGIKVAEIEFPNMGNNRYIINHTFKIYYIRNIHWSIRIKYCR